MPQQQQTRRQELRKAQMAEHCGAMLAKQRHGKKRTRDDMNDTEQKLLKNYESGSAKKAKQSFATPRLKPFRCNMRISD